MIATSSQPEVASRVRIGDVLSPYLACQQARGLKILVDIDPEAEVVVRADELARIIQNLVENAQHHGDSPHIEVSSGRRGNEVIVAVADSGPGIPDALFEVIFDQGVSS